MQKKTVESDGYQAVQLGFGEVSAKKVNKAAAGHFKKAGVAPKKYLREFRLDRCLRAERRRRLKADIFAAGDKVDVTGISKGQGYQGVIKRWRQPHPHEPRRRPRPPSRRFHGLHHRPSRIFKGKIGAGQMGVEQVTVQNLDVVKVDPELNMIAVRGAVPGPKGSLVYIKTTVKNTASRRAVPRISNNPQKASGRNPQKASARNK